MVALPLFKLGSLFLRHVSKYGANHIKGQAHDHPRFRAFAAKYGQLMHQINMRTSVALLRDPEAERRAKEKAEAPTVLTEEQLRKEEAKETPGTTPKPKRRTIAGVWSRKFRPLPENKAVDLFADVIGDTFILSVATALILYEYFRAQQKPDSNKEKLAELTKKFEELQQREEQHIQRYLSLEDALRKLHDPKTKKPLVPFLQETEKDNAAASSARRDERADGYTSGQLDT